MIHDSFYAHIYQHSNASNTGCNILYWKLYTYLPSFFVILLITTNIIHYLHIKHTHTSPSIYKLYIIPLYHCENKDFSSTIILINISIKLFARKNKQTETSICLCFRMNRVLVSHMTLNSVFFRSTIIVNGSMIAEHSDDDDDLTSWLGATTKLKSPVSQKLI